MILQAFINYPNSKIFFRSNNNNTKQSYLKNSKIITYNLYVNNKHKHVIIVTRSLTNIKFFSNKNENRLQKNKLNINF